VRTIAVGDNLRRLVANWLLATAQGRNAAAALAPLQTAFAKGSTGWLLLQVDLRNAFNSIARLPILEAL